ncbi:hypothetical protein [Pseudomonas extremorientalis]|uniref:hypothetical protein n=1 Tax=Pseudomonas extremorientalis TaxID=169669 RepID=UPI00211CDAA1|nr:hypothetical protein [Pseudomonas extremorientalis]UUN86516.1 hypothetical protein LUU92_16750 [Pseudomonas extremorientalis]
MTRWSREFQEGAFHENWKALTTKIAEVTVDDETVTTTVEELARLRKAITFVDEIICNIDPELTPKSVWTSCVPQAQACVQQINNYNSYRNATHLVTANEHFDNILTYVRPYMVPPSEALTGYGNASQSFSETVSEHLQSFRVKSAEITSQLSQALENARASDSSISEIEQKVRLVNIYLFEGVEGEPGAEQNIQNLVVDTEAKHREVSDLHQALLEGPDSLSTIIKSTHKETSDIHQNLTILLESSKTKTAELQAFYDQVFGLTSLENQDDQQKGLKAEVAARILQLKTQEAEHETRHKTMFKQIEALLPGATSAGLASSYKTLKDRFESPIKNYTNIFYGSMAALIFGSLFFVIDSVTLWPPQVLLVKAVGWDEMLRTMLARLPIALPVIWLAVFSATRRSQYERLQQEYAHKEAFASSYESYKKQLQDLGASTESLQQELIAKAIEAIAFNASKTLDGNHTEKPPIMQVLDKISTDDLKKLIEAIKLR